MVDQWRTRERTLIDPGHRWTISEATNRWLGARHGWSPLTTARYQRTLDRFTTDMGGPDIHLDTITPIDFAEWVEDLRPNRGRTYRPSALKTVTQPVRTFFAWAVQMRITTINPTLETAPPKVGHRPPTRLNREACRRLLAAADVEDRVRITLFLGLGLRLSELARLRVEDWDRERDLLTVLGKGNKVRVLPVTGEVKAELTGWVDFYLRAASGPLWPSPDRPGEPLGAGWIGRRVTAVGQRVGIHVHPHLLRHTALSDMLEEGIDPETVREVAGHATLATLAIYTSSAPEHMRRSLAGHRRSYQAGNAEQAPPSSGGA
jgi:integrase/recombinase XerC